MRLANSSKLWSRIYLFLVLVDAHSKSLGLLLFPPHLLSRSLECSKYLDSQRVLVSDNGTAITSTEFQTFAQRNGFRHIRMLPTTHPLMDWLNKQCKLALQKTSGAIDTCLSQGFFQYRIPLYHRKIPS